MDLIIVICLPLSLTVDCHFCPSFLSIALWVWCCGQKLSPKIQSHQRLPHVSLKWFMVELCVVCPLTAVVDHFYIYIYM